MPSVNIQPKPTGRINIRGNGNTARIPTYSEVTVKHGSPHAMPKNQPYNCLRPIYDFTTKNQSFIDTHKQLKLLGIRNNAFHLILLNPLLQGVDPHDPNISPEHAMMVVHECYLNIFYYLREVVRIDQDGKPDPVPFRMDRGTLAACYCFYNNINFYLMKPRQTGKTVGILALLSWAFKFSGPNAGFMFSCYREELSKKNLRGMRGILRNLPKYMVNMGTQTVDSAGKTVRKTDNIKTYSEPVTNNRAMVANCASSESTAEEVGRGYTQAYQFFDEAEFTKFIDIIVKVSGMSFNTASRNAEENGSGYCRIFATTPGDLGNKKACARAMTIVNDALVWTEKFYDEYKDVSDLKAFLKTKSKFRVIYIEYDYKQLGYDEEWFIDACANVGGDLDKIKREILLMRFSGNSNSPFTNDQLEDIENHVKKPLFVKKLNDLHEILFYDKPKKGRKYFIGVDPSEGTGNDNYAITVLDPYDLQVVAEFRSPYMTIALCKDILIYMVDHYFTNPLIVVERNRNGGAVIEFLKGSKLRSMIYSTPHANSDTQRVMDKIDGNGFVKEDFTNNKYFGTNTTQSSRKVMMGILLDAMQFARNLVCTKYIVEDVKNLVVKNDKIQAVDGEHDDSVMSWLLVMYIYYHGEGLERYGFRKGELPQDIQEDDDFEKLKSVYANPEIKKQFPTMYSYYLSVKKAHEIEQKTNREDANSVYEEKSIGSLKDIGSHGRNFVEGLDDESFDNSGDGWRNNLRSKFMSLNKK